MILGRSASNLVDSAKCGRIKHPRGIMSASVQVDVWSTNSARARERFSYWRDAVCRAVFNISIEAPPECFSARITARSSGQLRFATSESSSYHVIRNRRDIDSAPADHYSVFAQVHGLSVVHQCCESFAFNLGDICISDGRHPFRADIVGCRAFAVIPRAMIDHRAPWLRHTPLRKLDAACPFVDLARRHILELTTGASISESAMRLLTDNLCNLLALASATEVEADRLQPELQIEALLAYCRQNLHDAGLTPQRAADHLRISIRILHSRFKQVGKSFGRWVLDNRLEACRDALRDKNQKTFTISEIAYRWGFNDLSHFNKAFRARFEQSPRECRNDPNK
jgi:AraC family transcriptional regulator, positive regulator of tynA and feaB